MFDHFGQRLKRDLKKIVDRRIIESETASGSLIRVCCLLTNLRSFPDEDPYTRSLPALRLMSSPTRDSGMLFGMVVRCLPRWCVGFNSRPIGWNLTDTTHP